MIQKLRQKLNGNLSEILKLIIITLIVGWMFCQVRDIPAVYVTKTELSKSMDQMKQDREKQFDRIFSKLNDIEGYLREQK